MIRVRQKLKYILKVNLELTLSQLNCIPWN